MQNQFILVSFCNLPPANRHPLVCLEITPGKKKAEYYEPIAIRAINRPIQSVIGLTVGSNRVFFLFLSEGSFFLAALDREDLTLAYCQELPGIKDGHSILAMEDYLYIVSTGTDEVKRYVLENNGVRSPEIFWRASTSGVDTHHINSIVEIDGEIFVSAFGPKDGPLWSSAVHGYIHNITRDIRIKDGIYHPHSLSQTKSVLYYCDSSRKSLCTLDQAQFKVDGYARGIAWLSDERVCVGSSIGRRVSKSTGLIANPADPGAAAGRSRVSIGNIKNKKVIAEFDLSSYGPEIYDIVSLEDGIDTARLVRLN